MAEQHVGHEPATVFADRLRARFEGAEVSVAMPRGEVGIVLSPEAWHDGCRALRDEFGFEMLADLCGIDYLGYGSDEWDTEVSSLGFSRGVEGRGPGRFKYGERPSQQAAQPDAVEITPVPQRRYAVVAQLLSVEHNRRVRVTCFASDDTSKDASNATDQGACLLSVDILTFFLGSSDLLDKLVF